MKTIHDFFLKKQYLVCLLFCIFISSQGNDTILFQTAIDSLKDELIKLDNVSVDLSDEEFHLKKVGTLYEICDYYFVQEEYSLALPYYKLALDICVKNGDPTGTVSFLLDVGNCYVYQNINDTAMEYYVRANEVIDSLEQELPADFYKATKGYALTNIGVIYTDMESYPYALTYLKNAEQLFIEPPVDSLGLVVLYLNLGVASGNLHNYGEALSYFKQSQKYLTEKDLFYQNLIKHNVADVLSKTGKIDEALEKYFSSLSFYNKNKDIYLTGKSEVYLRLSELYYWQEDYDIAKQYLDSTFAILEKGGGKKYEMEVLEYAVDYYLAINNSEKAISFLKRANAIKDSIYNPLVLFNIENIQYEYDLRKHEREEASKLELLRKQQLIENYQLYGWLCLLGLLLAASIAFLYRQRNKMRAKKINILTLEAEKQRVTDELKYKSSQLTSYAMYINRKNEFMESIKTEVDQLKNEVQNNPTVSKLTNIINHHLTSTRDRKDFDLKVEDANKNFYYKLEKEFPSLTKTERKLCSLLLLELSSKEIATLMNIAPRSVDKNRFRLRKKLNVNSEVNLSKFLRAM